MAGFSLTSFDSTLGAVTIGFNVACGVFGILTTQVFIYYRRYFEDKLLYKGLVGLLWSLELIDQAFIGHSVYHYSVSNFGNPRSLVTEDVVWTLIMQVFMGAIVGIIVKCCYVMRVWRFSKHNYYVLAILSFFVVSQSGLSVVYTVRAFQLRRFADAEKLRVIASLSLGAGAATDAVVAIALCIFLRRLRTGYEKSDSIVNRLVIYAVNTGALTCLISVATLILYNAFPHDFYFMASYFVLGKVYAISFLCTLNTRRVIRGKGTDHQGGTSGISEGGRHHAVFIHSPRQRSGPYNHQYSGPPQAGKGVEIGVRHEISVISDIEMQDSKPTP